MSLLSDISGINLDTTTGQYNSTGGGLFAYTPFGAAVNAFSGANKGIGSPNIPAMDTSSANQITNSQNALLTNLPGYQGKILQGTGAAGNIQNQAGNQGAESQEEGGGGMPGMSSAIGNKAAKNFSVSQGKLQQQSQMGAMQMQNQNQNVAASNAIALQNAQTGVNSQLNQYNLQANAARYAVVGGLMSGAGSFGGIAAATMTRPQAPMTYGFNDPGSQPYQPGQTGSGIENVYTGGDMGEMMPMNEEYA